MTITRTTDDKARLSLPRSFANSRVLIEVVNDNEIRIRKANAVHEDSVHFHEENAEPLSNQDRDIFLAALDKPPKPNKTLRRAAGKYKKQ